MLNRGAVELLGLDLVDDTACWVFYLTKGFHVRSLTSVCCLDSMDCDVEDLIVMTFRYENQVEDFQI